MEEDVNYEINEKTTFEHSLYDPLIHAEVLLPHNDEMCKGIVKGMHTNTNGEVISQFDVNPLLNIQPCLMMESVGKSSNQFWIIGLIKLHCPSQRNISSAKLEDAKCVKLP